MRDLKTPTQLLPRLFIGPAITHPLLPSALKCNTVVLCAIELQAMAFPNVEVIRVPLEDREPSVFELADAKEAGERVARRLAAGKRVLVTCAMGLNRSALVCGIAIRRFTGCSGERAVRHIQNLRRGTWDGVPCVALSNQHFRRFLESMPRPSHPPVVSGWSAVGG